MALSLAGAALLGSSAPIALVASPQMAIFAVQSTPSVAAQAPASDQDKQDPAATRCQDSATSEDADCQSEIGTNGDDVIIVSGSSEARKKDPFVGVNTASFELTQSVDRALVEPIADAYEEDLPGPVRKGLRNFFRNLMEPVNALNYLLQLKPGKAFETLGRFAINSTVGVAGLFDVAKKEPFNLPYRRNGFANTLGYYGVGPGPFLVLPLVGATTLRDLLGSGLDQSVLPLAVGKPFNTPLYAIPAYTVNSLEFRINFDKKLEEINTSDDPYFALRETYLCQREADIAALKNRPPPRDCSIAALMGLNPDGSLVGETGAESFDPGTATAIEPEVEAGASAPSAEPEIVYISREVVQPIETAPKP